jgi:squalene-hopene/tetraprenyl-beta-curcumene cyclase
MIRRIFYCSLLLLFVLSGQGAAQAIVDRALAVDALKHTDYGLRFLRERQGDDGSWSASVEVTATALRAFLESYQRYNEADGAFITRPVSYLLDHVSPDGSIAQGGANRVRATAAALIALHATGNPAHAPVVKRAQNYLVTQQAGHARDLSRDDPGFGAIGSDLTDHFAVLEALHYSGFDRSHPLWDGAVLFITRKQVPEPAEPDGGRGFAADSGVADVPSTVAALAGLLYAGVGQEDARFRAGWDWFRQQYSTELMPGPAGPEALIAHHNALAKLFRTLGAATFDGPGGEARTWRNDLIAAVLRLYQPDGSFGDGLAGSGQAGDADFETATALGTLNHIIHSFR